MKRFFEETDPFSFYSFLFSMATFIYVVWNL